MSQNPSQMRQKTIALRFSRSGELQCHCLSDDAQVQSESLGKLLLQGRVTQTQLLSSGVVWVPTELLVLTEVALPAKRRAEINAALPYALEEQLAQPIENYHFVILQQKVEQQGSLLQVAAVAKQQMQHWKATLQSMNLATLLLVADCFALPLQETQSVCLTHLEDPQSVVCRQGRFGGAALPLSILSLSGWAQGEQLSWAQALWCKADFDAAAWRELLSLNLATGEFSAQSSAVATKLWLWPNAAAALLMATLLGSAYLTDKQAQEDARVYEMQSEQLFRAMFPDVKRVVNLKAQTLSRLAQADAPQNAQLMPLIYQLEAVFAKEQAVQIDEIRWLQKAGALQLKVRAPQSRQLQQLQGSLAAINATLSIKNVTPEVALGVIDVGTN